MTPADIIAKLFKPIDAERVKKAKGLAIRSRMDWADVLAAMTEDERKQVDQANA